MGFGGLRAPDMGMGGDGFSGPPHPPSPSPRKLNIPIKHSCGISQKLTMIFRKSCAAGRFAHKDQTKRECKIKIKIKNKSKRIKIRIQIKIKIKNKT